MKMKLYKMIPLVALMFTVTANSAFAVGKDPADDSVGKMCAKIAAALIKPDRKATVHTAAPGTKIDDSREPAVDATAM